MCSNEMVRIPQSNKLNGRNDDLTEEEIRYLYRDMYYTVDSRRWNRVARERYGKPNEEDNEYIHSEE